MFQKSTKKNKFYVYGQRAKYESKYKQEKGNIQQPKKNQNYKIFE